MKICIVGVGAIGGFIGTRLAANHQFTVSALARGNSLAALNKHGWRLEENGHTAQHPCFAYESAKDLGIQDVLFIALKTPALANVLPTLFPLIGPNTIVVSAMNGIPWWFFKELEEQSNHPFESVNPKGAYSSAIPYDNVVGLVVHAAATRSEPGLIKHKAGNKLIVGQANDNSLDKSHMIMDILTQAGFDCDQSDNIRSEIWYKLWGNMTINPISAITGATADKILEDPIVRQYCTAIMREAAILGKEIGCHISEDPESRHQSTEKLGAFKTSMLQDVECSNAIELDSILGIVCELSERVGLACPNTEALFGITRLFAKTRGLYPQ
jgi:2-dehydropantoate 2-reductase